MQIDSFIYHDFIHIISYYLRSDTYKMLLGNQKITKMNHKSEIWLHFFVNTNVNINWYRQRHD